MSNMSSHVKRWITGIIAVPLLIVAILYSSPLIFSLIITLLIAAGVFEYNSMIFKEILWKDRRAGTGFSDTPLGIYGWPTADVCHSHIFIYYGYFLLLLFIRMIFNKFSLKCHEYEKFWGYAKYK